MFDNTLLLLLIQQMLKACVARIVDERAKNLTARTVEVVEEMLLNVLRVAKPGTKNGSFCIIKMVITEVAGQGALKNHVDRNLDR